jgi:hypothetical protein
MGLITNNLITRGTGSAWWKLHRCECWRITYRTVGVDALHTAEMKIVGTSRADQDVLTQY